MPDACFGLRFIANRRFQPIGLDEMFLGVTPLPLNGRNDPLEEGEELF